MFQRKLSKYTFGNQCLDFFNNFQKEKDILKKSGKIVFNNLLAHFCLSILYENIRVSKETSGMKWVNRRSHSQTFFKIGFQNISQYSLENTSVRVSFLNKVTGQHYCNITRKETPTWAFSYEYCKIFKKQFFYRASPVAAPGLISTRTSENTTRGF